MLNVQDFFFATQKKISSTLSLYKELMFSLRFFAVQVKGMQHNKAKTQLDLPITSQLMILVKETTLVELEDKIVCVAAEHLKTRHMINPNKYFATNNIDHQFGILVWYAIAMLSEFPPKTYFLSYTKQQLVCTHAELIQRLVYKFQTSISDRKPEILSLCIALKLEELVTFVDNEKQQEMIGTVRRLSAPGELVSARRKKNDYCFSSEWMLMAEDWFVIMTPTKERLLLQEKSPRSSLLKITFRYRPKATKKIQTEEGQKKTTEEKKQLLSWSPTELISIDSVKTIQRPNEKIMPVVKQINGKMVHTFNVHHREFFNRQLKLLAFVSRAKSSLQSGTSSRKKA